MRFGQPDFVEFARSISFRKFLVWRCWLQNQWNKPSRSDYYVMQLDKHMIGLFGKTHDLDKFLIDWRFGPRIGPVVNPDDLGEMPEVDINEPPAPLTARQVFEYNSMMQQQRDLINLGVKVAS